MVQLYTNNAVSTLVSSISDTALSLTVQSGNGALFPNPTGGDYFLVTLYTLSAGVESNHEIVKVTARSSDVFTIVRAQESTTARSWSAGTPIELRLTAGSIAGFSSGGAVGFEQTFLLMGA